MKRTLTNQGVSRRKSDVIAITKLVHLNRTALSSVNVGDILQIELRANPELIVVMAQTGSAAGAIASPLSRKVKAAILRGADLTAKVITSNVTECKVRINSKMSNK